MKINVHQIWKEAKELKLNDDDFRRYLREKGVTASKESIDRQHEIAENILKRIKGKSQ